MGAGGSSSYSGDPLFKGKTVTHIAELMMPVYYSRDDATMEDLGLVAGSWGMITETPSASFVEKFGSDQTPLVVFYTEFYKRLFDISPMSKNLFKNDMTAQGKMLVKVISLALSEATHADRFTGALTALAQRHFKYGVKAVEYGLVGEVLLWSLALVIGEEYTEETQEAWVRVYSKMLKIMVPVAVECEMTADTEG